MIDVPADSLRGMMVVVAVGSSSHDGSSSHVRGEGKGVHARRSRILLKYKGMRRDGCFEEVCLMTCV